MTIGNDRKQLDKLIQNAWIARHKNPTPQLMDSFLGSVQDTLGDVLPGGGVKFFEFKEEEDHESILALSGGQLYAIRVEDQRIQVVILGRFPGGCLTEETKLEDGRPVEVLMRYDHPRLGGTPLEFTIHFGPAGRSELATYSPLRQQLRDWART